MLYRFLRRARVASALLSIALLAVAIGATSVQAMSLNADSRAALEEQRSTLLVDDAVIDESVRASLKEITECQSQGTRGLKKKCVVHLPQIHSLPGRYFDAVTLLDVAVSQFRNLKIIEAAQRANAGLYVIDEGLSKTLDLAHRRSAAVAAAMTMANTLFPTGVPERFSSLTVEQLVFLDAFGAVQTAYFLRVTDRAGRDSSVKREDAFGCLSAVVRKVTTEGRIMATLELEAEVKRLDRKCHKLAYTDREVDVLNEAARGISSTDSGLVLIQFGRGHDFSVEAKALGVFAFARISDGLIFERFDRYLASYTKSRVSLVGRYPEELYSIWTDIMSETRFSQ